MIETTRAGCAAMLLSSLLTVLLVVWLLGCATPGPPATPAVLIDRLCAKHGPGLHLLEDHSQLWCGAPRERT